MKKKVGFLLWSGNLLFAFVGVQQAQSFGWAGLKHKLGFYQKNISLPTALAYLKALITIIIIIIIYLSVNVFCFCFWCSQYWGSLLEEMTLCEQTCLIERWEQSAGSGKDQTTTPESMSSNICQAHTNNAFAQYHHGHLAVIKASKLHGVSCHNIAWHKDTWT